MKPKWYQILIRAVGWWYSPKSRGVGPVNTILPDISDVLFMELLVESLDISANVPVHTRPFDLCVFAFRCPCKVLRSYVAIWRGRMPKLADFNAACAHTVCTRVNGSNRFCSVYKTVNTFALAKLFSKMRPISTSVPTEVQCNRAHNRYMIPHNFRLCATKCSRRCESMAVQACNSFYMDFHDYIISEFYRPDGDFIANTFSPSLGFVGNVLELADQNRVKEEVSLAEYKNVRFNSHYFQEFMETCIISE